MSLASVTTRAHLFFMQNDQGINVQSIAKRCAFAEALFVCRRKATARFL